MLLLRELLTWSLSHSRVLLSLASELASESFATDASGQLNVFGHDRHALRVNGAQVRIFEEADHVGLGGLLKREHGLRLEPEVRLDLLSDLPHEALERQLPDEQLGRLLELADLTKGHRAWSEPMRLLDTTL